MFINVHALVSYPPSNPNRDDLGRPKTATYGGTVRQRLSSQSLKRAWRLSPVMKAVELPISTRTRRLGVDVYNRLVALGVDDKQAAEWTQTIAGEFGSLQKPKKGKKDADGGEIEGKGDAYKTQEIVILGPEELAAVHALVERIAADGRAPTADEVSTLELPTRALDTAMFGRMRADRKDVNVDAAVQVAHAITTNAVKVEADYWTAVDDLQPDDDSGAGGIGEREFSSGVYYVYACIDVPALTANLGTDVDAAAKGAVALTECIATVGPGGHGNSFANRVYAQYLRVDTGPHQPYSLASAFEKAVNGGQLGLTGESIARLEAHDSAIRRAYGVTATDSAVMNVPAGEGSLADVKALVDRVVRQHASG